MDHPAGESDDGALRVDFDRRLRLEFHGSDAGLVSLADKGHGFVPVGTLETLLKIAPEVLVIRPRNRGAGEDFPGLDTLSASGTRGIVAGVPEPHLGTGVAVDYVDTVEALHDQVYARPPSALSAPGTRR